MAQANAWRRLTAAVLVTALLGGCALLPAERTIPAPDVATPEPGVGPRLPPEAPPEAMPRPVPPPAPEAESLPEPPSAPSYHPTGEALVEQARREMLLGNDAQAGATLERALRIDGDNPWIWIELGHLRLQAGQHAAAESMARKALSLASRDPGARGAAGRLLERAGGLR